MSAFPKKQRGVGIHTSSIVEDYDDGHPIIAKVFRRHRGDPEKQCYRHKIAEVTSFLVCLSKCKVSHTECITSCARRCERTM
jgi:hypothetical protein